MGGFGSFGGAQDAVVPDEGGGGGGGGGSGIDFSYTMNSFFEDFRTKINMNSPSLLQDLGCLLRELKVLNARYFINDLVIADGIYSPGHNQISKREFNYNGHIISIITIFDPDNMTNDVFHRRDPRSGQVNFYEIHVRGEPLWGGKEPNLILIRFKPDSHDLFKSMWDHIIGKIDLWPCK